MPPEEPRGVVESARKLAGTGLAVLQNRVELLAVEIQEGKARLVRTLLLVAMLVLLGNMAAILVTATIIFLAPERAQGPLLVALSLLYALAAGTVFLVLRKQLQSEPPPFEDTVAELKKDLEWLDPRK